MKLKHLFFNALAVISFAACSSEAEEIKPAEKASTATLQLDMTGQYGSGNSDQTRALSLDGTEYPRFIHEEGVTDWSTHCFIRNEAGTVQFYALVDWNATTDADGNISLHIKNSTLTLQNSAGSDVTATETLPKAGERWYIAGIAGGGVLDETKSNVNFAYDEALDADLKPNQARIPITFDWTGFTIPTNTERAPRIVVQFKPQGTLFSLRVNNSTNPTQEALDSYLRLLGNVADWGSFDYSVVSKPQIDANSATAYWKSSDSYQYIGRKVKLNQGESANFVFWAMPKTEEPAEGFQYVFDIACYDENQENSTQSPTIFKTAVKAGYAYHTGLDVGAPKLALEYVTEYNLNSNKEFANSHLSNDIGYFNFEEVTAIYDSYNSNGIQTVGNDYTVPSLVRWRSIFPYSNTISFTQEMTKNIDESVQYGTELDHTYNATYYSNGNGTVYALRFASASNSTNTNSIKHNNLLTAYRYERLGTFTPGDETSRIKVTARFLGSTFTGSITDIANDSFWSDGSAQYVTREFYATGIGKSTVEEIGRIGGIWSRSKQNTTGAFGLVYYSQTAWLTGSNQVIESGYPNVGIFAQVHKLPVRLFHSR